MHKNIKAQLINLPLLSLSSSRLHCEWNVSHVVYKQLPSGAVRCVIVSEAHGSCYRR